MLDMDDMSDEDLARILKHAEQEINDGLFYTNLVEDGKWTGEVQCNKCKRTARLGERPFPHKLNCPMRRG